jgi:hypothetical protein
MKTKSEETIKVSQPEKVDAYMLKLEHPMKDVVQQYYARLF